MSKIQVEFRGLSFNGTWNDAYELFGVLDSAVNGRRGTASPILYHFKDKLKEALNLVIEQEKMFENLALESALGFYLSSYPDNADNLEAVVQRIRDNDLDDEEGEAEIEFWEPFEDSDPKWVADRIDEMAEALLIDYKKAIAISKIIFV